MAREYIRFDEIEDVLSSLDLLALAAPFVTKQPSYWKWTIVSAHDAFQGAMVCVLGGTSGIPVLEKAVAKKMWAWLETGDGEPPNERLTDFKTLLGRVQRGEFTDGHPLRLSAHQLKDVRKLHTHFRNSFMHFVPQGWSIERAGLPRIILTAVDGVEFLLTHDRVSYKLSGNKKRRIGANIARAREVLGRL